MRVLFAAAALAAGCSWQLGPGPAPHPAPAPAPSALRAADAGPSACERFCGALRDLGCDGYQSDCVPACDNIEARHASGESELTLHPERADGARICADLGD